MSQFGFITLKFLGFLEAMHVEVCVVDLEFEQYRVLLLTFDRVLPFFLFMIYLDFMVSRISKKDKIWA